MTHHSLRLVLVVVAVSLFHAPTQAGVLVELAALYDETWKLLIPVVAGGHAAVVEVEPTTGHASRLSLTRAQRDEI